MPRGLSINLSTSILIALAVAAAGVEYWKDPGLPVIGAKNGLSLPSLAFPVIAGWMVKLYCHE